MKKQQKWYVVWEGRERGVFTTWAYCQKQVVGYSGAKFKSFTSKAEAYKRYNDDVIDQQLKRERPIDGKMIPDHILIKKEKTPDWTTFNVILMPDDLLLSRKLNFKDAYAQAEKVNNEAGWNYPIRSH